VPFFGASRDTIANLAWPNECVGTPCGCKAAPVVVVSCLHDRTQQSKRSRHATVLRQATVAAGVLTAHRHAA
jgi:hypothetical protein